MVRNPVPTGTPIKWVLCLKHAQGTQRKGHKGCQRSRILTSWECLLDMTVIHTESQQYSCLNKAFLVTILVYMPTRMGDISLQKKSHRQWKSVERWRTSLLQGWDLSDSLSNLKQSAVNPEIYVHMRNTKCPQ